jgi:hypothetical protein
MFETSGVLRPAVEAYLNHETMTPNQIAAMRAYLRQWIAAPGWQGANVDCLRRNIDTIISRADIDRWLAIAEADGGDPL